MSARTCLIRLAVVFAAGAFLVPMARAAEQDLTYVAGTETIHLTVDTGAIALRASGSASAEAATSRLAAFAPGAILPSLGRSGAMRVDLAGQAGSASDILQLVAKLNEGGQHWTFTPILRYGDARVWPTGTVLFRLKEEVSASARAGLLASAGLGEVPGPLSRYGVLSARPLDDSDPLSVLEASRRLAAQPGVEFAHPDFAGTFTPSLLPNDTYFGSQWQFRNTGQSGGVVGADIHATDSWDITTGSSTVTIAVVDAGVDITHPEFAGRLVTGYDATDGSNNSQPNPSEYHGTACAGLALGAGNNGIGIAGVAWAAQLMPVRVSSNGVTTDIELADGILTAAFRGAAIISCSWEWGTPSPTLEFAINSALRNGRGGKGCVVVFAAGDEGGGISYPARLPGVISVGATDPSDVRWSYSNYGPELSMVAPSGNHLAGAGVWTTDNRGAAGANPGNVSLGDVSGDYSNQFDGTSAACPLVAGAAALLLGVRNLSTTLRHSLREFTEQQQ